MKNYFILTALLCSFYSAQAQSSLKSINYQAIIVDPEAIELPGNAVQAQLYLNKDIWVKFRIYAGTTLLFEELHKTKTDGYGLINLEIGGGENTGVAGAFALISWGGSIMKLETQVSFDLGFKYTEVSNRGLNYLPYSYFAEEAGKLSGTLALTSGGTGAITAQAARANLGLDKVDNTADASKPISMATQTALDLKANIVDVNAALALKATVAALEAHMAVTADTIMLATKAALTDLNDYAPIASPTFTGTVSGITKSMVGLGSADNTTDAAKPISTATKAALDLKLNSNGNAAIATKLATARNINGVAFDGSADITITSTADAGTLTGTTLKFTVTGSSLTSVGTLTNLTVTNPIAGSITGNAATATTAGTATTTTGNAASATKLATARNINGVAFDGSADITIAVDANTLTGTALASNVVTSGLTSVGTLTNLTVTNPIAGSITGNAGTATNLTGLTTSVATLNNLSGVNSGDQTTITGNAGTATKLAASKTINGVAFDGTADITAPAAAETLTGTTLKSTVTGSSLTSVGTITSGVWSGTAVAIQKGGTGLTTVGTNGQVLTSNGTSITWATASGGSGVPYTGATGAVDLGAYDLKVYGLTIGRGGGNVDGNTANGNMSLYSNSSGYSNTAYGSASLYSNTSGSLNTANGFRSLYSNIASYNTAYGSGSLSSNTTGGYNTANGVNSLYLNTTGSNNTANGLMALYNNTTGGYNTANGVYSLYSNTTGYFNVANGYQSLYSNTTGSQNTAVGYSAGRWIANGSTNNTKSDYSVYLGSETKASADNAQNEVVIGYNAIGAGSNTIQLGNTSVTNVKTSGTITAGSITYPSAHGTANQVLSTTGSGTLTWTTPSSGGSGGGTYTIGLNADLGGYVFFLSTDSKHGLVAETQDQSTPTSWYDAEDKISNQANHSTNGKKFTDWRLPTKHELNLMYSVKNLIGGFAVNYYWSSTEVSSSSVGAQDFRDGYKGNSSKDGTWYVRAVRAF